MKQFITLAAVALLISTMTFGANSIDPTASGTIAIAAAYGTNTTDAIWIGTADDSVIGTREIESFIVYNATGTNTATATLIMIDGGIETTIATSGSLVAGASAIVNPTYGVTESVMAGYIVTNYPVFYTAGGAVLVTTGTLALATAPITNNYLRPVLVPTTTTVTKYSPYRARQVKVRVIQSPLLGPGTYNWFIKTK